MFRNAILDTLPFTSGRINESHRVNAVTDARSPAEAQLKGVWRKRRGERRGRGAVARGARPARRQLVHHAGAAPQAGLLHRLHPQAVRGGRISNDHLETRTRRSVHRNRWRTRLCVQYNFRRSII